jgi:YfiH family protein
LIKPNLDFELLDNVYRVRPLQQFDWLEHGFGNRSFHPPETITTLRQIHSDIAVHTDRDRCPREGDALLSGVQTVGVKTADCIPILLVDERHRAVAAVHAGWRGTVARIAQKAIQAMSDRWGTAPKDLHAAIGPGIGACCYEVGPEVSAQFAELFPERRDLGKRVKIDLVEANRRQLLQVGVAAERIYAANLCTFCDAGQFHSFRRDGEAAGRMISFIGIVEPPSRYEKSEGTDRSS